MSGDGHSPGERWVEDSAAKGSTRKSICELIYGWAAAAMDDVRGDIRCQSFTPAMLPTALYQVRAPSQKAPHSLF